MVNFEPGEEQRLLQDLLSTFAVEEIRPLARLADETGVTPAELADKAWQLGLVTSAIPERFGGFGDDRSAVTGAITLEALGHGDLSLALHALVPRLFAFPIVDYGTDAQKERWLPAFAGSAFHAGSAALVEPAIDFDLSALRTTFRKDGSRHRLRGRKVFVPLAAESDALLVYARDGEGAPSDDPIAAYRDVQAFVVERGASGFRTGERERNMGLKALATYEIELDDVLVDEGAKLGGEAGIDFARIASLSRVALGALAVGVARAAFEHARDYAKERKAFGVPIAQKQAIAFLLAEMAIEIDAARMLVWEAAWRLDRMEEATPESFRAKAYAAATAMRVCDDAIQVLGGYGYVRDHPVERFLRNARGFANLEGLALV